ncbi:MAG: pimeloyl-ACP methyl ester esterase BioH [Methylococcaceae bacterium]|nr:pimeloyl-ACP methyl ester esterase BioH [Methylococcaceae bacterium]
MNKNLHIEIYGQGKTIVLLHGWAMHTGIWRAFAKQLAQQARVVCVDLPGHGCSPLNQPFELAVIAAEIVEALDEAPCYWLGWSFGALLALEIARQYPEKVRGLVLLAGTPCFVNKLGWAGMDSALLESFADNLAINPQLTVMRFMAIQVFGLAQANALLPTIKASVAECPAPAPAVLQAGLGILKNQDLRPVLVGLHCPVLAILGTRDTLVPVAVAPHLQQLSAQVQVQIIEQGGHLPFLSHPEVTVRAVIDFLNAA